MEEDDLVLRFLPIAVDVEAGKIYRWCGCGKSLTQPFCDRADCNQSVVFQAANSETIYFCRCKETKDPPFCDGSHAKVMFEYLKQHHHK
ncbi:CDGSH iron-sulfur domain-containing protein [Legionella londiniensis]|uniref:Glutamate synthetase n=1 Tax=Legionella londiniensis TaxID=45068 RepID=A0A0W0VMQ7_9GAMM|nr:CDGSH iron-sulfur domain-containing protein [Legionella londiniensis]KTD21380.1 glutamate synthetase [Legionella londiniensis]STX93563.1 glutamate synthetase [Legionella londiniensis]